MWGGFYVYIVASGRNGTIYVGMTDDLVRRVSEHKAKFQRGFTRKYGCDRLVWFEAHPNRESAFARERQIKEWRRAWKISRIEELNPDWNDLFYTLNQPINPPAF